MGNRKTVSVVIPCWNGRELLSKNLQAVLEIGADEVIIVDDSSSDGSVEYLKKNFPQIKLIEHQRNSGFGESCNDGVSAACGEIIILLNQDTSPSPDLLKFVCPHFNNEDTFAVSFNESKFGWAKLVWQEGIFLHKPGSSGNKPHLSGWASGGSAAFRKSVWQELGGFSSVFKPFYWEDLDLSYRAWKRGYRIVWEPEARVVHHHESSIGRNFPRRYIDFISQRNQLIFIWRNISDKEFLIDHWHFLAREVFKHPGYFKIILSSLLKLPNILSFRQKEKKYWRLRDKEILSLFNKNEVSVI